MDKKEIVFILYELQKDVIQGMRYSYNDLEDYYDYYNDNNKYLKESADELKNKNSFTNNIILSNKKENPIPTIKFKKLHPNAKMPTYGTEEAAGLDLYAVIDNGKNFSGQNKTVTYILPKETKIINTGIAIEIPNNCFGGIYPRSGLAIKKGLNLANSTAVIDSDYRGEIKVALYNQSNETQRIENGDRIAQLVIQPYIKTKLEETDELSETDRGNGGFGSTGIK